MKSLFLFLILSVGLCATWGDYIAPIITKHFPREMTLTNKDGDIIEVTLIRRDKKNAYFRMEEGPIVHSYEIAHLNFLSRCKVKLYPRSSPKSMRPADKERDDPAQMHLNSMYEQHEDLLERIKLLEIKLDGAEHLYTAQAINRDIVTLENKANAIIYKIEDIKYRYPHIKPGTKKLEIIKKLTEESESKNKAFDLLQKFGI